MLYTLESDLRTLITVNVTAAKLNDKVYLLARKPKDISQSFEKLPLRLDSNVYLFEEGEKSMTLFEAYRIDDTVPITIRNVGSWSPTKGLMLTMPNIWERRRNLEGFQVPISASHVKSNVSCSVTSMTFYVQYAHRWTGVYKSNNGSIELTGKQPDIWWTMEKTLNMT